MEALKAQLLDVQTSKAGVSEEEFEAIQKKVWDCGWFMVGFGFGWVTSRRTGVTLLVDPYNTHTPYAPVFAMNSFTTQRRRWRLRMGRSIASARRLKR